MSRIRLPQLHQRRTLIAALAGLLLMLGPVAAAVPSPSEDPSAAETEAAETEAAESEAAETEAPPADAPADADADADASLAVVVLTNGVRYDQAPGARVATGSEVEWTYELRNTGDVDLLLGEAVEDWRAGDGSTGRRELNLDYDPSDPGLPLPSDPRGLVLEPGDSWITAASATAIEGQYSATVTVQAQPVAADGTELDIDVDSDEAASYYLAGTAGISVATTLNGQQTPAPPGLGVAVGAALDWEYVVTNTGTVELSGIELNDVGGTDGASQTIGTGSAPLLAPGEQVRLSATGKAAAGQFTSTTSVRASSPDGGTVEAADQSWFYGGSPAFTVTSATNGIVSDAAPGAIVATGSTLETTVVVTNTGDTYLSGFEARVTTTSPDGGTITAQADSDLTGPLAPGDRRTFATSAVAGSGQYQATVTVDATAVNAHRERLPQQPSQATSSTWFLGGTSGLTVTKLLNDSDVTSAPGPLLVAGEEVRWSYVIVNTGAFPLTQVEVSDIDTSPSEPATAPVHTQTLDSLAPGESVTLTATGAARQGEYHNTVTVTAFDGENPSLDLSATDESWYHGGVGALAVTKQVRTQAGELSSDLEAKEGAALEWEIVVTNDGTTTLTDVVVRDGDIQATARNEDLEPGESATFVFPGSAREDLANTVEVEARDPEGTPVTASASAQLRVIADPEVADADDDEQDSSGSTWLWWLVGGLVLAAGAAAVIVIRKRREASSDLDSDVPTHVK